MNGKTSSPSLYLSQSYQDAWDDYNRSLRSSTFPVWDYIVLTASNEHQARSFELQIQSRKEYLPPKTIFAVIPDEDGVRVGSGGATLSVLRYLDSQGGWKGKRILVIHSGGDSKQSVERLKEVGAVNTSDDVDIDTGALIFGTDVLDSLFSLISTDGTFDEKKHRELVNSKVRLSLYGDFQYPLAEDSTLEQFYLEKPEGEYCDELKNAREKVWNVLHPYRLKLLRLAPAKFIHFGTTREILHLMNQGVENYKELGWGKRVNCSLDERASGYNSVLSPKAKIGDGCFLEVSYVHSGAKVGEGSVLSYIDVHDSEVIPSHVVLHGLKQTDGKFVCRIFGAEDNPKENKLFGHTIPHELAPSLWLAPIYPEKDTIKQAVAAALDLYEKVIAEDWDHVEQGKSLASGFNDADPEAIIAWDKRMSELVQINSIEAHIDSEKPVSELSNLHSRLTKIQKEWFDKKIKEADFSKKMRLNYYIGSALNDEKMIASAFFCLSDSILASTMQMLEENRNAKICIDELEVKLPLRVNWGGGWSDTPPYCNENGGTVLNAAILLNGERPVSVRLKKLKERKIIFDSQDMGVHGEFDDLNELQKVGDPFDPFVLQKAALLACGVIPKQGGTTPFHPYSPYAVAKQYAYWIIKEYREAYGMFAVNGILFNHESERRGETFVTRKITLAVGRIAEGLQDHLELGNLDSLRDWGYAKDYVECMWLMLQADEPEDYVIATGEQHTVRDFTDRTFKENGIEIRWEGKGLDEKGYDAKTGKMLVCVNPAWFRPTDVDNLWGDPTKAKTRLGWNPQKTSYEELIHIMATHDRELAKKEKKMGE